MQITEIIKYFDTGSSPVAIRPMVGERINETFLVDLKDGRCMVAQRLNNRVLVNATYTMANIEMISGYLETRPSELRFLSFFQTTEGGHLYTDADGDVWRAYQYVEGVSPEPGSVESAAILGKSVGMLHQALSDFPVDELYVPTEHYHNTPRRYEAYLMALSNSSPDRLEAAQAEISFLKKQRSTCSALLDMDLPARVTHNNVKLDHLVIDPALMQPLCFVDYDHLMPGVLAFDFGNGARSCCKDVPTDTEDLESVQFRLDLFDAYAEAYLAQTIDFIDGPEAVSLPMGAVVMSLELGIRYLTDYLIRRSTYSPEHYSGQNLARAKVQLELCRQMQKNYPAMVQCVKKRLVG